MDLVCDTNVFYDLGAGRREIDRLKSGGHRLLASPVNFIEISSRLSTHTFEDRRAAAQAVVDHATLLKDPERHFAEIWKLDVEPAAVDWMDGFKAIARASDISELESGVRDLADQVERHVSVPNLAFWRALHYEDFVTKMENLIDSYWPGYAAARRAGKVRFMNKKASALFEKEATSGGVKRVVLLATRERASVHASGETGEPTDKEIEETWPKLQPYVEAYCAYVVRIATLFAPRPNDWGDLECFAYLQDDRRLLTRDKRWIDIAVDSGLEDRLLDPELPSTSAE